MCLKHFLLTPESAIFVSVTISAPVRIRCFAISTAFSEKVSVSAYPKSALVWITLFVTGSCSSGSQYHVLPVLL